LATAARVVDHPDMEILATTRARGRGVPFGQILFGLVFGTILLATAISVAYLTMATPFLISISAGPLTLGRVVIGVLAWTLALTAPVGFGLLGMLRIIGAIDQMATAVRRSPTVRIARSLGDQAHVAANVLLPDGRPVPELVIGPFGAAVISELPPARTLRRVSARWEQRVAGGLWRPIEDPRDRAVRDAERVRRWFGGEDQEYVVRVHAAVVDASLTIERTPACAVIAPGQIAAWLAALPLQRGMTADRRAHLVAQVRATL
jgi:hypothetical protein